MSSDWDDAYYDVDSSVPTIDTVFLGTGQHMPSAALLLSNGLQDAAELLIRKQVMEWVVKLRGVSFKDQHFYIPDEDDFARIGNVINAQLRGLDISGMGDESRVRWVELAKLSILGDPRDYDED